MCLKDKSFGSGASLPYLHSWVEWMISLSKYTAYCNILQGIDDWGFSFWFLCGRLWFWFLFVCFDEKSQANHYSCRNFLFQDIWCYLSGLWAQHSSLLFLFPPPTHADACWKRYWNPVGLNGVGLSQRCAHLLWLCFKTYEAAAVLLHIHYNSSPCQTI